VEDPEQRGIQGVTQRSQLNVRRVFDGSFPESAGFEHELNGIRRIAREQSCVPLSTAAYANDIITFVMQNRSHGRGIVELGCYRGGLTVALALLCRDLAWPLYVVDISSENIEITRNLLKKVQSAEHVQFFTGTLNMFADKVQLSESPLLAVIDGDHRRSDVISDIASLYSLNRRCYAAAFHDFSLRVKGQSGSDLSDVRVDRAIFDCFGPDAPLMIIGESPDFLNGPARRLYDQGGGDSVATDTSWYWEEGGHEGVILVLPRSGGERVFRAWREVSLALLETALAERRKAIAERDALLQRFSWRMTAPLRRLVSPLYRTFGIRGR
jgi:predicted O-methyltransferase YrrM